MNANQKLHQARLCEWAARFRDQKASGLTVPSWCEQNHLSVHAYNYWKHQLKQEAVGQMLPEIVPLSLPGTQETSLAPDISHPLSPDNTIRAIRPICASAKIKLKDAVIEIEDPS